MFEVTLKVVVGADTIEEAKASAIQYFNELEEINDDEIREMK